MDKLCADLNRYGKAARGMEKEQRGTAMCRDGDERSREAKDKRRGEKKAENLEGKARRRLARNATKRK